MHAGSKATTGMFGVSVRVCLPVKHIAVRARAQNEDTRACGHLPDKVTERAELIEDGQQA